MISVISAVQGQKTGGLRRLSLFTIGWLVSVALHALHRYHPFPEEIFSFVSKIELYLVYADSVLSGIVLLAGMVRFCRQLIEVER
jgi:hypothetical protein